LGITVVTFSPSCSLELISSFLSCPHMNVSPQVGDSAVPPLVKCDDRKYSISVSEVTNT
jgi:hypothetical protein